MRDAADYTHQDTANGPTNLQGVLAHTRGVGAHGLPALLDPRLKTHMPDPYVLSDMQVAADMLSNAIFDDQRIVIFGDYDVDGATSSAIVDRFLRMTGHSQRSVIIPNREFGYGFGSDALHEVLKARPSVLILLDCGTQNHATIQEARAAGVQVIVVDHHQPGEQLPNASALINPHRRDETAEGTPLRTLCTAGLAFMLVVATNRALRLKGYWHSQPEPDVGALLDLVALGTVCDVMPLVGLNRSFVINGLNRLNRHQNGGLVALARVAGVKDGATATSLGFHLGPRINAGGRIGKARLGADLLSNDDPAICDPLADQLNTLNQERQAVEKAVQAEALDKLDPNADIIVVAGEGWHEGVIGIVAGRLKEQFNRPVIVLAIRDDGVVKGSGRSIPGVDLGRAVMDARAAGILEAGGGHLMACGLTMRPEMIEPLRAFLNDAIGHATTVAREAGATMVDAALWTNDLTLGFLDEIEQVGPYGQGWPKPRFILGPATAEELRVTSGGHVFLTIDDQNGRIKAKAWRAGENGILSTIEAGSEFLFLGSADLDTWNGSRSVSFTIEDVIALDPVSAPSFNHAF